MYLKTMKTNVVVAIDDVHPEEDWGVEGDELADSAPMTQEEVTEELVTV